MIIRKLTMHNFGVYAGTNTFDFTSKKPIVLIGGMNGRGKTTFLEAILLSLYGSNSFAYKESNFKSYGKYLKAFVNKNDWSQSCYIELEFVIDQDESETYLIHREWNALSKRTRETITVFKNGEISDFLTKNWAMFVENMLPSALSNFFFFDGEKIAELAVDNTNQQVKDSIRSMLGISVLDVLKNDLLRNLKKIGKKSESNESFETLERLRKEKDQAEVDLASVDSELESLYTVEKELTGEIETLGNRFEAKGGDVVAERHKLLEKRSELYAEYTNISERLIDTAAAELPFALVPELVEDIKMQAEDEHSDAIMNLAVQQLDELLQQFNAVTKRSSGEIQVFVDFAKKQAQADQVEIVYDLSDHALLQVGSLVEEKMENSVKDAKAALNRKVDLVKELDEVESYLSLDINEKELEAIQRKIKDAEKALMETQLRIATLQQKRSGINANVNSSTAEFNRYVEKYLLGMEARDDNERKIKYSNLALKILEDYTTELQKSKTGTLATTITRCYKLLANKKNLIKEIQMDARTLDLHYVDAYGKEVSKDSLSAGEKQLMVIAILWALATCSKKKLPVIIDTPLSRLDSQHRTSIITTYFPNASDQTIILSTDTEIDQNYYDMMKEAVGDEFTLEYSEETRSTSIKKGYFQES